MLCLSRGDIEKIGMRVFSAYKRLPALHSSVITHVDPELLLEQLLGLHIEYLPFSPSLFYLGVTSFDEDYIELYYEDAPNTIFALDGNTVVIEASLANDPNALGRRNFSLAHEGCHHLLKRLFPNKYCTHAQKHYYAPKDAYCSVTDWDEWQANALASVILMPRDLICAGMRTFCLGKRISVLNSLYRKEEYEKFCLLADHLGVSKKALEIRMIHLGLIEKSYLGCAKSILDVWPEKREVPLFS